MISPRRKLEKEIQIEIQINVLAVSSSEVAVSGNVLNARKYLRMLLKKSKSKMEEIQKKKGKKFNLKKGKKSKCLGVVASTVAVAVSGNELNEPELNSKQ